ncbi:MAG: radical SAM/SPASM domain-containing protein [Patescibacteria group bacterium]|nr:radical SAM/SPASM domain-containing protein [Patescibacteria group bacterium]
MYWLKDKISKSTLFNRALLLLPDAWIRRVRPLKEIIIEASSFCNLRCPFCIQRTSTKPRGFLTLKQLEEIESYLPRSIKKITLHFSGESFANPEFPAMVKYLKDHGYILTVSTNGTMPVERYREAVGYGIDNLIFAMDGASAETQQKYRVNSDFNKIVGTLRQIAGIKNRKTRIIIQFLVMKFNEREMGAIEDLGRKLGVDALWFKSASFNIGSTAELQEKLLANALEFLPTDLKNSRYRLKEGRLVNIDKPKTCPWIWRSVILWNGDVGVCCTDLEGSIVVGNVFEERSFNKIWQSDKYAKIRRAVIEQELPVCKNCSIANKPIIKAINLKLK